MSPLKRTVHDMSPEPQASQQDKLDETLTEEDVKFLSLFENVVELKEKKVKLKKKESRHRETDDKPQQETKDLSKCCEEGEGADIFSDSSCRSRKKKRERKRAATECDENCPPQELNEANEFLHTPDPFKAPVKIKKKKQQVPPEIQGSDSSPSSIELHRPDPGSINGGKTKKTRNKETTAAPTCEATSRNGDGTCQRRRKHPLSLHRSNMVAFTSTPSSSPAATPNTKWRTNLNGQTKAINGWSDHSQDLFITQKQFLSPCGGSEDSPPLGQEQGRDWMRSHNPPHQLSQFSCPSADRSSVGSNQQVVLREKATQTDDGFTYLALMSFVKKVKVLEPCSVEAIDLSLPSRIRAKTDVTNPSDDVILVESQSPPVGSRKGKLKASEESKIKFCFGPLQNAAETKFIQTVLNASYFFKGKGEPGEATPITPLLKMEEKPKKKTRKSRLHTKKR